MTQTQYPHKILIVEDEEIMLKTLVDNLTNAGFGNILKATNGVDGLDVALREKPDLILLDILMPVMDGRIMMNKLRQAGPYGQNVPIIFLTNLPLDQNEDKMIDTVAKVGTVHYFVKADNSIDSIINIVKRMLDIEPSPKA